MRSVSATGILAQLSRSLESPAPHGDRNWDHIEFGKLYCESLEGRKGSSVVLLGLVFWRVMAKKKNSLVFMDVSIDGDPVERMVFELFYDVAPKTAENFRALCTGERGVGPNTGKSLHYKGSFFHRIIKGSIAQPIAVVYSVGYRADGHDCLSCDIVLRVVILSIEMMALSLNEGWTGGESIYGSKFPDESPWLKHDASGLLSMPVADRDTLGSNFIITFKADPHLDRKHVVFGRLVLGHDILKKIEDVGDKEGLPSVTVKIINCGEHNEDEKKIHKSKKRRNGSSVTNSHELHKGKYRKSSGDKRKRRKYYLSDSDSSSDSDTKSSESDSDSDSDISSSSYTSSSSEDRRRKRKRSRKDKLRRGKRRDKHREKRLRKLDKRSKRRSRRKLAAVEIVFGVRESPSHTDSDSESKSNNCSDGGSCGAEAIDQKHEDHSQRHVNFCCGSTVLVALYIELLPEDKDDLGSSTWGEEGPAEGQSSSVVEKELPPMHAKKWEKLDMLDEEGFPTENGERCSNGTGVNYRSERREGRQPDVMDDQPSKSRSQSMSISPRCKSKSPNISPKKRLSRSPSGSRSPRAPLQRSLTQSPVRSISRSPNRSISRSPVRGRKGRSITRRPVKSCGHRNVGASPKRPLPRSYQRTSPGTSLCRSISRSPARSRGHRSVSTSQGRSPSWSQRRSSHRAPSRRSISTSPARNRQHRSLSRSPGRSLSPKHPISPRGRSRRSISRSPVRTRNHRSVNKSPVRSRGHRSDTASPLARSARRSKSPGRTDNRRSVGRSPTRSHGHRSRSASPVRLLSWDRRRSSPKAPSRRSISRSPVRVSRKSISRSPVRSSARSLSRSSGRVPLRSISRSPVRVPSRGNRRSYSRSPRGRSLSKSVSPDVSPKRIRRGRGFSERYSYARRYRTPSRSPVRSYRHNGRSDRDRYSGCRRYSPKRSRSPLPPRRTPPRFRSRRSRTLSVSRSPRYRLRRSRSRSHMGSRSPVGTYRRRVRRSRSLSRSQSPSLSKASAESESPRKASRNSRSRSPRSPSESPDGKKGLVSYGDASPDSN
ncbi:unnamed protein product [Sphenostylis stenocarpa]|uniref:PPIase cyclophilin-type domain-containing protein n=1 Tax=Sphenostylis stenocarpa TaxID=92480 RepID=A0AA86VSD7_9FABA|nr:unnamed protein product [Sphenostylis stenocarpa]